ncbi:thioredoxin family protein [Candidatus Peregrinibacteria bacterium]|nr:thioredoxin family protein [Candidatus Peregrinibacteria bacterium]MBI3816019.1 thioredoxin family protein [Candidatus Peregrinibacteria bacterium]
MKNISLTIGIAPLLLLAACNGNQPQAQNPVEGNQPSQIAQQEASEYASSSAAPAATSASSKPESAGKRPTPQEQKPVAVSYKAGAIQPYSDAAYKQALADGKTVVIDFHANWCPICKVNAPHIQAAFDATHDPNVVGFIADYDTETALEDQFGVSSQSTIVKVRGNDPGSAKKIGTLGPGPLTTEQVTAFLQS